MSASLRYYDSVRRYAEFFIDSEEDLSVLPTLTGPGTGVFSTMMSGIALGSAARLTNSDSEYYRIRGDGAWFKIVSSGGGGQGTNDYNELVNRPTINGVTVEGNMTSDDIDVAPEPTVQGETLII